MNIKKVALEAYNTAWSEWSMRPFSPQTPLGPVASAAVAVAVLREVRLALEHGAPATKIAVDLSIKDLRAQTSAQATRSGPVVAEGVTAGETALLKRLDEIARLAECITADPRKSRSVEVLAHYIGKQVGYARREIGSGNQASMEHSGATGRSEAQK